MELKSGYKQTEAGVIPEDWEVKALKEISPRQSVGLVINPSKYFDPKESIPMLVGSSVTENRIDAEAANRISAASNFKLAASRLTQGDLVTVRVGDPGVTAVVPPELDQCNCASMMIVRQDRSFNSHWLCSTMNSRHGRQQVENVQYGTAQKQFNIKDAVNFIYAVPPLQEQNQIATVLSEVELLLMNLEQVITKKRNIKQAAMQELLTGKRRLPGFEGEWEVRRLDELGEFVKGSGVKKDEATSGDLPCVRYGEIYTHHENYISEFKSHISTTVASRATAMRQGDILFAGSGETKEEIGKSVALVHPVKAYAGGDIVILRQNAVDALFLGYRLNAIDVSQQKAGLGQGDAVVHISTHSLSKISVSLPGRAEQEAIAGILYEMDIELKRLQLRLAKTQMLKQGMMQQLLTGKIRLK